MLRGSLDHAFGDEHFHSCSPGPYRERRADRANLDVADLNDERALGILGDLEPRLPFEQGDLANVLREVHLDLAGRIHRHDRTVGQWQPSDLADPRLEIGSTVPNAEGQVCANYRSRSGAHQPTARPATEGSIGSRRRWLFFNRGFRDVGRVEGDPFGLHAQQQPATGGNLVQPGLQPRLVRCRPYA